MDNCQKIDVCSISDKTRWIQLDGNAAFYSFLYRIVTPILDL